MISTIILTTMLAIQQRTDVIETVVDHSMLSASIECKGDFPVGEPITMLVKVRDYDTRVLYNPATETVRAEVYTSGGVHRVVIDPHHRGAEVSSSSRAAFIRQDQIVVKELGWDKNKQWFHYEITVTVDPEGLPNVSIHLIAIEIQDTNLDDWNKDKPHHLAIGFTLHKK